MIRPLRRRHLVLWTMLAIVLPGVLLTALVGRAPTPLEDSIPWETRELTVPDGHRSTWADQPLEMIVGGDLEGRRLARLRPLRPISDPDLLVYWIPAAGSSVESGVLLGTFDGRRPQTYELPSAAATGGGSIALYSLAHGEMLGRAPLEPTASD